MSEVSPVARCVSSEVVPHHVEDLALREARVYSRSSPELQTAHNHGGATHLGLGDIILLFNESKQSKDCQSWN